MIKSIVIKKLFGQFDYRLNFYMSGITIITGPNGFGKSTILKIIESIEDKDLYEISRFSFSKLEVELNNGDLLRIEKGDNQIIVNEVALKIPNKRVLENLEKRRELPFIERISPRDYIDLRDNTLLTYEEVREMRSQFEHERDIADRLVYFNIDKARGAKSSQSQYKDLNSFLIRFRKELGPIKFIKEQRLLRKEIDDEDTGYFSRKREIAIEVINEIPKKIKEEIKNVVLRYSEVSSQLDSTFPKRLFNTTIGISREDYLKELGDIIVRQEKIQDYKLLNELKYSSAEYTESYSQALRVYLQDTKQKLEVFDDLINRLDLFTEIINSKLNFKKIIISNENGLTVIKDDGTELDTSKLSSGEQQIIVVYYELIFGVKDKLTLLIDEPEISLHVAWQRELLKDFKKIIKMKNEELSLIVATHAPQVIDNNWDLVIDLGEQYD